MNSDYIECFRKAAAVLLIVATVAAVLCLTGCKSLPTAVVPEVHTEYVHDTLTLVDSVYQSHTVIVKGDCEETHDTIYKVKYKDKIVEKIVQDSIPYPVEVQVPVRYRSGYDKFCSWGFWILVIVILLRLAWWAAKMYIKAQGGGLFLPKS